MEQPPQHPPPPPQGYYPPPQGYPPQGYYPPPYAGEAKTSGMAIAGFVLSFFCSLLGLIFSCIGYSECKKSNGQVTGEGLAIAGIVISIIGFLLSIVWWSSISRHGRF